MLSITHLPWFKRVDVSFFEAIKIFSGVYDCANASPTKVAKISTLPGFWPYTDNIHVHTCIYLEKKFVKVLTTPTSTGCKIHVQISDGRHSRCISSCIFDHIDSNV